MNKRNILLSGILLLLCGILIGGLIMFWQRDHFGPVHSTVHYTKIKESSESIWKDSSLQKLGPRFLFEGVAAKVKPTIVYITSIVSLDSYNNHLHKEKHKDHHFWYPFRTPKAKTVGSGVIISSDGYIVTNAHVIRGAVNDRITVELSNKRQYHARISGKDPTTDLAVLKINGRNLPSITIGNSNNVHVGQWVLAFGNPFELRRTVTAGIISAINRDVHITGEIQNKYHIYNYIQTDAAINKGNSGGALVNTSGRLIGINTAIASRGGDYQGYGFAIPSNLVKKVSHDLIQYGKVHRAILGVQILGVDYKTAKESGLKSAKGVQVVKRSDGAASTKKNLNPGDIILAVDGKPVNEANQLQEIIALYHPGDWVELKIWRDDHSIIRDVQLHGASDGDHHQDNKNEWPADSSNKDS
jgi:S1-C subfamily serine protease